MNYMVEFNIVEKDKISFVTWVNTTMWLISVGKYKV